VLAGLTDGVVDAGLTVFTVVVFAAVAGFVADEVELAPVVELDVPALLLAEADPL